MWSSVAPILAATSGWNTGTCTVEYTRMVRVSASSAAAHVMVSSDRPRKFVLPPNPRQRLTGNRKSNPAASAACAIFRLVSYSHSSGSCR